MEQRVVNLSSNARLDFARRLRELRAARGFRTARSLARALDIDENRYTRYERAEVEPDLGMIRKICEALGVSAADLLGGSDNTDGAAGRGACSDAMGREDRRSADPTIPEEATTWANRGQLELATAAWSVGELVCDLRRSRRTDAPADRAEQPLADVGETSRLYHAMMRQPYETLAELLNDGAVMGASADKAHDLKLLIDILVHRLKENSGAKWPARWGRNASGSEDGAAKLTDTAPRPPQRRDAPATAHGRPPGKVGGDHD